MEPAIRADHVTKRFRLYHEKNSTLKQTLLRGRRSRYEEFQALDDVSLDIPEGSTFALIGQNGSGKSTLLKCMARILRPDAGSVSVRGRMSALLELGAGFHLELSGRENVYLNGSILGLSKKEIDARFDEIVDFAGGEVPRFIDNPVKNYSSGMFVRLGFAIAITVSPDVLLVDEILAVGDEDFQRKCLGKFGDLHRDGRTVVVVSHGLEALRNLCDQAAWLDHGRLRQLGAISPVVDAYLDEVSARRDVIDGGALVAPEDGRLRELLLLDPAGLPTATVRTGDPLTIRVGLRCQRSDEPESIRLAINGADGTSYARASSLDGPIMSPDGPVEIHELDGDRWFDYRLPRVLLPPMGYRLSLSLLGPDGRTPTEELPQSLDFEVVPGSLTHRGGVLLLDGGWGTMPAVTTPSR